jgi:hypothetical protein
LLAFFTFVLKQKGSKKFKAGAKAPPAQPCPRTGISPYYFYLAFSNEDYLKRSYGYGVLKKFKFIYVMWSNTAGAVSR